MRNDKRGILSSHTGIKHLIEIKKMQQVMFIYIYISMSKIIKFAR